MNIVKKIFYSDKALHIAQGITIGLAVAVVIIEVGKVIKSK